MLTNASGDETVAQNGGPRAIERLPGGMKLSDFVYAEIAGRIRSGGYPVESRLPTENELADALGVSRPIIREALARLRNDGVVVSRRGSGTYVQREQGLMSRRTPPLTSIADMKRCLEYRISLEGECAWHAATGPKERRDALDAAVTRLEQDVGNGVLDPEHDFEFHHAIAIATGNRFFYETMNAVRSTILTVLQITPNFISPRSRERLAMLHDEHLAIHAAILADEPEAARTAMRMHLSRAMQRIFEGL